MGFPGWGNPGTPVVPGDPTSEAVNQYGTSGLYHSRGAGRRVTYENPDFGNIGYDPRTGYFRLPEITTTGSHEVMYPEMGRWVAPAEPRDPFVPILDVRPTPVPSSDLVPVAGPSGPSSDGPRGERKQPPKKRLPSTPGGGGRGYWWLFKGGYYGRA